MKELTFAEQGDIGETLAFEQIQERRCQIAAETVPLEAELLLMRVHDATLRFNLVTFTTPLAATFQWIFTFLIALVPNCSSSYAERSLGYRQISFFSLSLDIENASADIKRQLN